MMELGCILVESMELLWNQDISSAFRMHHIFCLMDSNFTYHTWTDFQFSILKPNLINPQKSAHILPSRLMIHLITLIWNTFLTCTQTQSKSRFTSTQTHQLWYQISFERVRLMYRASASTHHTRTQCVSVESVQTQHWQPFDPLGATSSTTMHRFQREVKDRTFGFETTTSQPNCATFVRAHIPEGNHH